MSQVPTQKSKAASNSSKMAISDSRRIWISVYIWIVVLTASFCFDDMAILLANGIGCLFGVGFYVLSFTLFSRKSTHAFKIPMSNRSRCAFSGILTGLALVAFQDHLGLLGAFGISLLFGVGLYLTSFLFFSKKVDSPLADANRAGVSKSS
ncbi:MAG: hypothetical protein OXH31_06330 [Gammaproteobacteria bacterium]|nr:hypothetical protein [Gammaproteobacteria bacterium]